MEDQQQLTKSDDSELPPSNVEFGHALKRYYEFKENHMNLNHGSFGASPKFVTNARQEYIKDFESKPDFFLNFTHPKILENRQIQLSQYVDADPQDLVFVKNATEAATYILKSLEYKPGDIILMFDFVYGAVKSLCNHIADQYQVELIIMETNLEVIKSKDNLIQIVQSHITSYGQKIKIAIIDYISSTPALCVPVKDIILLFRENNILCMIDAAHTFNHIDFSIRKLDPDFYYSNIHKWAPMPKSLAFIYIKKEIRNRLFSIQDSQYRDFSNIYCLKETLEFIERLGRQRMMDYCKTLAHQAGQRISDIWGTELLIPTENNQIAMINVVLPCQNKELLEKLFNPKFMLDKLQVYIVATKYKDFYYVRFSCYIYNQLSDYEFAANLVMKLLQSEGVKK